MGELPTMTEVTRAIQALPHDALLTAIDAIRDLSQGDDDYELIATVLESIVALPSQITSARAVSNYRMFCAFKKIAAIVVGRKTDREKVLAIRNRTERYHEDVREDAARYEELELRRRIDEVARLQHVIDPSAERYHKVIPPELMSDLINQGYLNPTDRRPLPLLFDMSPSSDRQAVGHSTIDYRIENKPYELTFEVPVDDFQPFFSNAHPVDPHPTP